MISLLQDHQKNDNMYVSQTWALKHAYHISVAWLSGRSLSNAAFWRARRPTWQETTEQCCHWLTIDQPQLHVDFVQNRKSCWSPFHEELPSICGWQKSESQFSSPWTLELLVKTNYFEESDLRQSFWTLGSCPCISSWYRQICKHFTVHSLGTFFANHFDPEVQIMMVIWVFFLASMAAYFRP